MSQATVFTVNSETMNACARATDGHGRELGPIGTATYCTLLSFMKGQRWVQISLPALHDVMKMPERGVGKALLNLALAGIISIKRCEGAPSIYTLLRD
jgi:hypothetical protein